MKIEGYFSNMKTANDTIKKLKESGYNNAYFDLNDHYIENRNVQTNFPGSEDGTSLSDLVLESGATSHTDRSKSPLAAANPAVSGMGNMEEVTDINCKVVVSIDGHNVDKIKAIIRDMGGDLENPNIEGPRITGDEDKVFDISLDRLRRNL